jgi:UDP-N-acetylglucosamine 2-epimerase (non-hydrolysing)
MSALTASRFPLTDSGGIQEEATYVGIPCLPITVSEGSNRLTKLQSLEADVEAVLMGPRRIGRCPAL